MPSGHYRSARRRMLHRDVWEAHHPDDPPLTRFQLVHHINEDPGDNRLENLRVVTPKEHTAEHPRKGAVLATPEEQSARSKRYWAGKPSAEYQCVECGARFLARSAFVARYCSQRCRDRVSYRRKRALSDARALPPG